MLPECIAQDRGGLLRAYVVFRVCEVAAVTESMRRSLLEHMAQYGGALCVMFNQSSCIIVSG